MRKRPPRPRRRMHYNGGSYGTSYRMWLMRPKGRLRVLRLRRLPSAIADDCERFSPARHQWFPTGRLGVSGPRGWETLPTHEPHERPPIEHLPPAMIRDGIARIGV